MTHAWLSLRLRALGRRFAADEKGSTAVEYSLIAAVVSVGIVVAVSGIGSKLRTNFYEHVAGALDDALSEPE